MVETRTKILFNNFINARRSHTQINSEIDAYKQENQQTMIKRFKTLYDYIIEIQN